MNILHVINAPGTGGAEIFVKDLAIEQGKQGHVVHVGFIQHAIDCGRSDTYEDFFLKDLNGNDIHYFFLPENVKRKPWLGVIALNQYVKSLNIDIYHSHLSYGLVFGVLLKVPRIYTHHNILPRVSKRLYRFLLHFVEQQVGISKVCTESLAEYSGKKVVRIDNAINLKKFSQEKCQQRILTKPLSCLAVGRITKQKNYYQLIDVIAALEKSVLENIELKIAGEADSEEAFHDLENYIVEKNLQGRVILLGNRTDIADLMRDAQIFVMSSLWEGLPIALIEASVSGLPCLVTDVGACGELVTLCKNGIVVPVNDVQSMANALARFLNEPKLIEDYSRNALASSSVFGISECSEKHLSLYDDLLAVAK